MRPEIFEKMNSELAKQEGEEEQHYMERILGMVFEEKATKDSFDDMLRLSTRGCDAKEMTFTVGLEPEGWEDNHYGILHGGIISTVQDIAMGLLAKYYMENKNVVTVQMTVDFLNAVSMDKPLDVKAYCVKRGRRVCFLRSELMDRESGRILSTAIGTYM